jgi:hypothetical protein
MSITPDEARGMVARAVRNIVPSGVRIDEDDYPGLTTTAGYTDLLVRRGG